MSWKIKLESETNTMSGNKRIINMLINDTGESTIINAVMNRPDSFDFIGVSLFVSTPLHRTEYVIEPDTKKLVCLS